MSRPITIKFGEFNSMFKNPTQVLYGYNTPDKQFEHVVLGAKLKMETYLGVDHCIYALSKSTKKPIKVVIDYVIKGDEDLIKILTPLGIRFAETLPDIRCFIYQCSLLHPSLNNDLANNVIAVGPVPTVLVYAHDNTGRKKYFLREFATKENGKEIKPVGWKNNSFYEEINKVGWFVDKKIMQKYILFDLPLNIMWNAYNTAKNLNCK